MRTLCRIFHSYYVYGLSLMAVVSCLTRGTHAEKSVSSSQHERTSRGAPPTPRRPSLLHAGPRAEPVPPGYTPVWHVPVQNRSRLNQGHADTTQSGDVVTRDVRGGGRRGVLFDGTLQLHVCSTRVTHLYSS